MAIGFYTDLWDTAVSPYTIFGPLCLVISFSLLVEGLGDWKRHQNDKTMNEAPCVVLHRISRNDWDMDVVVNDNNNVESSDYHHSSSRIDASQSSSGAGVSSSFSTSKRKRMSKKKRKKRNKMDLSERFDFSEDNTHNNRDNNNTTASDQPTTMPNGAATSERMKKSAERISKKFGRGVEIHRNREINEGRDITVPLLPSILEDNDDYGVFDGDTLEPATANARANFQATAQSKICFRSVPRRDIRQGQFVLIRNREMVPADIILMASSADHGSAYIETSSIDGETNLKLRSRPAIPSAIVKQMKQWRRLEEKMRRGGTMRGGSTSHNETILEEEDGESDEDSSDDDSSSEGQDAATSGCTDPENDVIFCKHESLDHAVKRITCTSALGNSRGFSITEHPMYKEQMQLEAQRKAQKSIPRRRSQGLQLINQLQSQWQMRRSDSGQNVHLINTTSASIGGGISNFGMSFRNLHSHDNEKEKVLAAVKIPHNHYVAALTSEPPNPYVHTFSGKLTLPTTSPFVSTNESVGKKGKQVDGSSDTSLDDQSSNAILEKPFADVPLDAENMLLRGAVLRNTEWAIGLVVFTGTDTKLVQNSFETPSKLSQLDVIMNWTVVAILCILGLVNAILASLFIVDHRRNFDQLWYLGYHKQPSNWPYLPDLPAPEWEASHQNWLQMFFLFLTLLNNVIPMSLYVTVEFLTAIHQFLIHVDQDMYDDTTNTRAIARSTNVTDLGRVQYIFSDKTGMLVGMFFTYIVSPLLACAF